MYEITVTSDFFDDAAKPAKPAPEGNLTGSVLGACMDSTGRTWYMFELPDVFGVWVVEHGSRFMVSISQPGRPVRK